MSRSEQSRKLFEQAQEEQEHLEKKWAGQQRSVWIFLKNQWLHAPIPRNANWLWGIGSMIFILLLLLLFSGTVLALWYVADRKFAFESVLHMQQQVQLGWLFRAVHVHGSGIVFTALWLHIGRSIYYGSFKPPRDVVWYIGGIIFVFIFLTSYLGQILSWSAQGHYAYLVFSNSLHYIPLIGDMLHQLVLGVAYGEYPRLAHIYAWHTILAFMVFWLVGFHIIFIHISGSNNPLGVALPKKDHTRLYPWAFARDGIFVTFSLMALAVFVFFFPEFAQTSANWQPAEMELPFDDYSNPWYFAAFVSMMQAAPNPWWGGASVIYFFLGLFLMPMIDKGPTRSAIFRPVYRFLCIVFFVHMGILWLGALPMEPLHAGMKFWLMRQAWLVVWLFFPLVAFVSRVENKRDLPSSIEDYRRQYSRKKRKKA